MNDLKDSIEIPINPETHYWFMTVIKGFDMSLTIKNGCYIVGYNNPLDLYLLGCKMAENCIDNFRTQNDGMSRKNIKSKQIKL